MRTTYVLVNIDGKNKLVEKSEAWRYTSNRPPEEPIQAHMVAPDLPEYDSPITGEIIRGRAQRREDLKKHGCRPFEAGEREHAARVRRDRDEALRKSMIERLRWINA